MLSPEVAPFAKTGGLADVVEPLSIALERLGHEVSLIMPAYRGVFLGQFLFEEPASRVAVALSDRSVEISVLKLRLGRNIRVYLIRADHYYDREFLYGGPEGEYPDNPQRFSFFCRAALELLRQQPPDIVHCHEWHSALAAVFLKIQAQRYPELACVKTVLTFHNLAFQGIFSGEHWQSLDLPWGYFSPRYLEYYGNVNFLKGGLVFADKITTVSPSYAREAMAMEQGFGLDGVLRERADDLVGILNGVDDNQWNPASDPHIAKNYGAGRLTAKRECKKALQRACGLAEKAGTPLIAMVSRLTARQGVGLVEKLLDSLLECDVQMIVMGAGRASYQSRFAELAEQNPQKLVFRSGFEETFAHQIFAGADIFLMPSRYEPCGLNQLCSLKYGTIPVVHGVGGLKDTVQDYDPSQATGTGFVFDAYEGPSLLGALDRALQSYRNKRAWSALRRRAMSMDFSWDRAAAAYSQVYEGTTT